MTFKNTYNLFILLLIVFFTSCGIKKTIISKTNQVTLRANIKSKIQAINHQLNSCKYDELIASQIIEDSIREINKTLFLFIKKETHASTEKIGIPIYGFKKLKITKKNDRYLIEVKIKHKKNKSHIGFYSEGYKDAIYKYDFILNNAKINTAGMRALKQDFKNLIASLKIENKE